jgi:hypothetical protein
MKRSELKQLIREIIEEQALTYSDQISSAYKKAKREKNVEAMAYYSEMEDSSASVSFETFKNSWAYEMWKKKPETIRKIKEIQDDMKKWNWLEEGEVKENADIEIKNHPLLHKKVMVKPDAKWTSTEVRNQWKREELNKMVGNYIGTVKHISDRYDYKLRKYRTLAWVEGDEDNDGVGSAIWIGVDKLQPYEERETLKTDLLEEAFYPSPNNKLEIIDLIKTKKIVFVDLDHSGITLKFDDGHTLDIVSHKPDLQYNLHQF